jgi:hypothetical protein
MAPQAGVKRVDEKERLDSEIETIFRQLMLAAEDDSAGKLTGKRTWEREFRRLVRRDYVRALRRHLGYQEVKSLFSAVTDIVRSQGGDDNAFGSLQGMRSMAAKFSLHFKAEPYDGPEGLALRGFYANRGTRMLAHPLIYVNTAHAALVISATFCHEFAHYLTSEMTKAQGEPVHFFYDHAYASHLDDPVELAADAIVSLTGYPREVAEQIFSTPWSWGLVARVGNLPGATFTKVHNHLKKHTGFDFHPEVPAYQNLQYLAGMIHYAKLRWALLAEYDL